MKNFLIMVLVLVIAGLAYANRTLLLSINSIANHPSSTITVVNTPAVNQPNTNSNETSPGNSTAQNSPAPGINSDNGKQIAQPSSRPTRTNLDDEITYLKNQIKAAGPSSIDQQLKATQAEITNLTTQLKNFQSAESAQVSAASQLQLQQSMNQHMIQHLNYQIQSLDRQERLLHRNYGFYGGQFDVTTYQPIDPTVQAKLTNLESQIQAYTAQRDQLSAQNLQQSSEGSAQIAQSQTSLDNARNSVRAQISFLQDELGRLQTERARSQDTVKLLQQELVEMQQHQNPNSGRNNTTPSPSSATSAEPHSSPANTSENSAAE